MPARTLLYAIAITVFLAVSAPVAGAAQLYWSAFGNTSSSIAASDADGANGRTVVASAGGPWATAVDAAAGRVYWATFQPGMIKSAKLDGTDVRTLATPNATVDDAYGMGFDPVTGTLYWADTAGNGSIEWATTDGLGSGRLYVDAAPRAPVVDRGSGMLYWTNEGGAGAGKISRALLAGGGTIERIDPTGTGSNCTDLDASFTVLVDRPRATMYLSGRKAPNTGTYVIQRMALDGTGCEDLIAPRNTAPTGMTLDLDRNRLIYVDSTEDQVRAIDLTSKVDTQIAVTGGTTVGIAYPALLAEPVAMGAPAIAASGATTGATLTCSVAWDMGLVSAMVFRSPASEEYAWTRDGLPVVGASGSTLIADAAGAYRCAVTARNGAGATTETSAATMIAAAPAPAPDPGPAPSAPSGTPTTVTPAGTSATFTVAVGKAAGRAIRSTITVAGPGRITQVATRTGGGTAVVCRGKATAKKAGVVRVTCTLTRSARAALRGGGIAVTITTTFTPTGGSPSSVVTPHALAKGRR